MGLPDKLKRDLANVEAQHGYYAGRHVTPEILDSLGIGLVPDSYVHPVFTSHEETGRRVLYISRLLTTSLLGLPKAKGDDILDRLLDHVEKDEFVYEHKWAPGDFVICTGETHSVREFLELAFNHVNLSYEDYVTVDERFFRPAEVDLLVGDASLAKEKLGWVPKTSFSDLVTGMVDSDLEILKNNPKQT